MSKATFVKCPFSKYQGAGNDFILIDDRSGSFPNANASLISRFCHRKWGIGADGLILLQNDAQADFRMRIFNPDGGEASSCGNGLRCFYRFLTDLGFPVKKYRVAIGGRIVEGTYQDTLIFIDLGEPQNVRLGLKLGPWEVHALNTGVDHAVVFVPDLASFDLLKEAPWLRHHTALSPQGANVNFAKLNSDGSMELRTFERGVEGETLACGTGAGAAVVAASMLGLSSKRVFVDSPGGRLEVIWDGSGSLWVGGPAHQVFSGTILADLNCSVR